MKKILMLAAMAMIAAAPAMAKDESPAEMQKHVDAAFAKGDTDSNGSISKSEWQAESDQKFAEADANSDGNVTKEEKLAFMKKEKAEMKAETSSNNSMSGMSPASGEPMKKDSAQTR